MGICRSGRYNHVYNGGVIRETGSDPNANEIAWYGQNSGSTTNAVQAKLPNAWGLYDMSGNVFEWTWDWLGAYLGDVTDHFRTDLWLLPCSTRRQLANNAGGVRVALRNYDPPGYRGIITGFRLARTWRSRPPAARDMGWAFEATMMHLPDFHLPESQPHYMY